MSTPVVERPRAGTATRTAPPAPPRSTPVAAPSRGRVRRPEPAAAARTERRTRPAVRTVPAGRAPFVLTVMALLGVGLVATLWLSTAAAADSYRLQDARTAARELSERSERLHREVAALQSPPALAQRAAQLGMVPAKDPARLVVAADGAVRVVGDPTPAKARTPGVAALPRRPGGGVAPAARLGAGPRAGAQPDAAAAVAAARTAAEEPGRPRRRRRRRTRPTAPAGRTPSPRHGRDRRCRSAADTATDGPPAIGARPAERTGAGREGAGEDGNARRARGSPPGRRGRGTRRHRSTNRDTPAPGPGGHRRTRRRHRPPADPTLRSTRSRANAGARVPAAPARPPPPSGLRRPGRLTGPAQGGPRPAGAGPGAGDAKLVVVQRRRPATWPPARAAATSKSRCPRSAARSRPAGAPLAFSARRARWSPTRG